MKIIEITYRYDGTVTTVRPRPSDAEAARARLEEGSRSIGVLLDSLTEGTGTASRSSPWIRATSGSAQVTGMRPSSAPMPRCSAAPTRACRSS